jgi:hypothetical protein
MPGFGPILCASEDTSTVEPLVRQQGAEPMEDAMKKILILVLLGVFATIGFAAQTVKAQEKKEKPAVAAKEVRWHGTLVRISKDASSLDVRKGTNEKKIYYDSSTKWTKGTTDVDMKEFKDGSDVICLGKYDEKGDFHATRIDLRR